MNSDFKEDPMMPFRRILDLSQNEEQIFDNQMTIPLQSTDRQFNPM